MPHSRTQLCAVIKRKLPIGRLQQHNLAVALVAAAIFRPPPVTHTRHISFMLHTYHTMMFDRMHANGKFSNKFISWNGERPKRTRCVRAYWFAHKTVLLVGLLLKLILFDLVCIFERVMQRERARGIVIGSPYTFSIWCVGKSERFYDAGYHRIAMYLALIVCCWCWNWA